MANLIDKMLEDIKNLNWDELRSLQVAINNRMDELDRRFRRVYG